MRHLHENADWWHSVNQNREENKRRVIQSLAKRLIEVVIFSRNAKGLQVPLDVMLLLLEPTLLAARECAKHGALKINPFVLNAVLCSTVQRSTVMRWHSLRRGAAPRCHPLATYWDGEELRRCTRR